MAVTTSSTMSSAAVMVLPGIPKIRLLNIPSVASVTASLVVDPGIRVSVHVLLLWVLGLIVVDWRLRLHLVLVLRVSCSLIKASVNVLRLNWLRRLLR